MTANVMRYSPAAALSVPRIGAWSASLTIHLAIIALLLSAPAAIKLVQYVKPEPAVRVRMIDPVKPIAVPLEPVPVLRHSALVPVVRRPIAVATPQPTPIAPAVSDLPHEIPTAPVTTIETGSGSGSDVAPGAIAYGTKTKVPYPIDAMRLHEQGTVILRVLVDADGKVVTVEIETSSGSSRLDRAARDAVKSWSFNPARHGGVAYSAWARVPVNFNLSNL